MWVCPECKKEFIGKGYHMTKHGQKVWHKGLTIKEAPQMSNWGKNFGDNKGHPNYFTQGHTQESLEKISKASKEHWNNPEIREKAIRNNSKPRNWSEEQRKNQAERMSLLRKAHPEWSVIGGEAAKKHYEGLRGENIIQDNYPIEWNRELKRKIKNRDNWTCQDCGITQNQLTKERKWLVIHHLDGNKENLNSDNLITMCRPCHTIFHHVENRHKIYR